MTEQNRFKTIITVELTILAVCLICLLPVGIIYYQFLGQPPAASTPEAAPQTVEEMQTAVANLSLTLEAPDTNASRRQIPVTGTDEEKTPEAAPLLVTFIDVGQGDAILIQTQDGKFGLIDGGPAGGKALKYLQSHGVEHLELVVASVPRPEHIGGVAEILNAIPASRVVTNGQTDASPIYEEFLDAVAASDAVFTTARRGDRLYIGSQRLDVLHPGSIIAQDLAVNSLVLRLAHEKTVFLFMGDAVDISAQEMTASVFPLETTILKVGHHAGPQALSRDFLSVVQPKVAIYSPGDGGDYDLPSEDTIAAIKKTGAEVYGTDSSGTIAVISSAAGYTAAAELESQRTPEALPAPTIDPRKTPLPASAPAPELSVVVTELTSPIRAGQDAAISIETSPGAICANIIKFSTGQGGMTSLGIRTADQNGAIGWSWRVGANATPGTFMIDILCNLDGQSAGGVIPFVVMK